jgi:HK97 family phage major capsid protein
MSKAVLDKLREERDSSRDAAIAMASADDFDPTAEAYVELEARSLKLDDQITRLVGLMDSQAAADALDGKMSKATQKRAAVTTQDRPLSIGEQWIRSDIWAEYPLRGTSAKLEVQWAERALPHSLASMADAIPASPVTDLTPPAAPDLLIPLTNVVTVSTNSIDYIVWVLKAGAAAIVPEKGSKPELEWEPDVTSSSLDTIAGRTSFTRQLAEDAPAVRSFIDGELQREVSRKVEAEAKAALAAATLPTATGPAGSGVSGAIRAGKAAVQAAGFNPNAVVMSADDAVDIDIASMAMFRGDAYWGLVPVIDPDATAGTVTVGDFKAGVQHYRRNSVQLYVTDSHGTHFAENILDALAEQRCKTVVTRPAALVEATAGA